MHIGQFTNSRELIKTEEFKVSMKKEKMEKLNIGETKLKYERLV